MKIVLFKDVELQINTSAGLRNGKLFYKNSGPITPDSVLKANENSHVLFESECKELIDLLQIKPDVANPKTANESTHIAPHYFEIIPLPVPSGTRATSAYVYLNSSTSEVNGSHGQPCKFKRRMVMLSSTFHLEPFKCPEDTNTGCDLSIMVHKGDQNDATNQFQLEGSKNIPVPDEAKITFRIEGSLLDNIAKIFSDKFGAEILLQLTVSNFLEHFLQDRDSESVNKNSEESLMADLSNCLSFKTKEMEIIPSTTTNNAYCETKVTIPQAAYYSWVVRNYPVDACYTLKVILKDREKVLMKEAEITKQVLEKGTSSDVTIIAGDDTEFKCHKAYLLAHDIKVFQSVLRSDLQDTRSHDIKMNDLTGEGVKALLQYVYFYKVDAGLNFEIAFQLLKVAEKYDIQRLKDALVDMMLKKEDSWFIADSILKTFVLSMRIDSSKAEELKRKAVKILKA